MYFMRDAPKYKELTGQVIADLAIPNMNSDQSGGGMFNSFFIIVISFHILVKPSTRSRAL